MTTSYARARRDSLAQHIHLVDAVSTIAQPPADWTKLRTRWDEFTAFAETPMRERLIAAVVTGDGDVGQLRALAAAEAISDRSDLIIATRAEVYPRLVKLYSPVATTNYAAVAKEFDATASEFSDAADKCDPEAGSDAVVTQPDSVRSAWLDTAKFASRLDALVPVLCAAVELAGLSALDDTVVLPLTVDPSGLHRRRLWEAWRSGGERCGRWSALVALGARIRAADLGGLEAYRLPKPLVYKQFPLGGPDSRGIYRPVYEDPEDEDYVPEEPKPRQRALAR